VRQGKAYNIALLPVQIADQVLENWKHWSCVILRESARVMVSEKSSKRAEGGFHLITQFGR
jgi:hypothetical protein